MESSLIGGGNRSGGIIVRDLVICIIWNESHVERGITTRVLRRGWHSSVWVWDWLVAIVLAIALAVVCLHRGVAKTVSSGETSKVVTGPLYWYKGGDKRVFGVTSRRGNANSVVAANEYN